MTDRSAKRWAAGRLLALALATAWVTTGCGGGSGSGGTAVGGTGPGTAGGGLVDDTAGGFSVGTITGFGSIYVNGIHYDTDDAVFQIDGSAGTQDQLAVGDKVTVVGTVSADGTTGVATLVTHEAEIEAPVAAIDLVARSFLAGGQIVFVSNDTVFEDDIEPGSLEGLAVGDFVEVSGYFGADGALLASRVELEDDRDDIEIMGFIDAVDSSAMTFRIGQLTVDFSAAFFDDLAMDRLVAGTLVEVYGREFDAAGVLVATRVEGKDDDRRHERDGRGTLSGFITTFFAPDDFEVNGQPVTTTPQTDYVNGGTGALGPNVRVTVIGEYDADGVLVARRVVIKLATNLRVEAPIESVDAGASTFTVLGVSVRTDSVTQFEDDDDRRRERYFDIEDLSTGDFVEVRGVADPDGIAVILATRVERDDDDDDDDLDDVEIRGYVERVDATARSIVLLGLTVQGGASDDAFFSNVVPGDLVEAEGRVIGERLLLADELEFEGEDYNDGRDHWRGDGWDDDDDDDDRDDD